MTLQKTSIISMVLLDSTEGFQGLLIGNSKVGVTEGGGKW